MALKTLQEQLDSVQEAIAKIERGGQSYGIAGRSIQRAEYQALLKRERDIKTAIFRQKQGTSFSYFVTGDG